MFTRGVRTASAGHTTLGLDGPSFASPSNMRNILWCSIVTATFFVGAGCKKTESRDKTSESVKKAAEDVKDLAETELAAARTLFETTAKERYAKLETRIVELEAKADAKSKETAAALRARREQLKTDLNKIGTQSSVAWSNFKNNVNATFDTLEKDVDEALK